MLHTKRPFLYLGLTLALGALSGMTAAGQDNDLQLRFSLADSSSDQTIEVAVSGKITDAATGQPIRDAQVRGHLLIWRNQGPGCFEESPFAETTSNEEGTYQLAFLTQLTSSGPMKGRDLICVDTNAPGYETRPSAATPYVTSTKSRFTDNNIALRRGRLIKGRVVDQVNSPVKDAIVLVQNGWNATWDVFGSLGKTRTDDTGTFEIWCSTDRQAVIGRPWLRISKPGYGTGFYWDILDTGSLGTLKLTQGGTIVGRVVDATGKGVPNCEVWARDTLRALGQAVTDANGMYELKGIPGAPSLVEFHKRRSGTRSNLWGKVTIYARTSPQQNLRDVPQYMIQAADGQTVLGPALVVGQESSVAGRLIPQKTTFGMAGLMVRLDYSWDYLVEADAQGKFHFAYVSPGEHRLTAFLPNNLRGDRGIGHVNVHVEPAKPLDNVRLQLQSLVEARVQILNANGNPLEGITAGATWTASGEGFWTEGTRSDKDGWSVLHLYPDSVQYVRGFDPNRRLVAEGFEQLKPRAGQVIDNIRIVMLQTGQIRCRLLTDSKKPFAEKDVLVQLAYADGVKRRRSVRTDSFGRLKIKDLAPGILTVTIQTAPAAYAGSTTTPIELKPGQDQNVGDIALSKVKFYKVSGKLLSSPTFASLAGFKIRLDLEKWEPLVSTDADGSFVIDKVQSGRHRLTAYLPHNLRTDRGVGHVYVHVDDANVAGVQLQLETLATIHMRIADSNSRPLQGIAAAAWWNEDHSGVFTEGTRSDKNGMATLYLYPDRPQFVGALDWNGRCRLQAHKLLKLTPGEVISNLQVVMQASRRPTQ